MINFPERIDQIEDLTGFLTTMIESAMPQVDLSVIPDEYKDVIMEKSLDEITEEYNIDSSLRPYMLEGETCKDIASQIEYDYVTEAISERQYKELKRELDSFIYEAVEEEFAIGAMLPQPGGKSAYAEDDDEEELLPVDEAVIEYINNPDYRYTYYVEKGIGSMIHNVKSAISNKLKTNTKLLKAVGKKVALKTKIRVAKIKKADPNKINDLEKELLKTEENIRTLRSGLDPETLKELEDATNRMEEAIQSKQDATAEDLVAMITGDEVDINSEDNDKDKNTKESVDEEYTEAYFGKSPLMEQMEVVAEELVHQIKLAPTSNFSSSPLNQKLENLFEKQFGFKKVYIIWDMTPADRLSISTLCSSDILFNKNYVISKDSRNGFYDKNHVHVAYIRFSVNAVSYLNLSSEELIALMLYTLGSGFDSSLYQRLHMLLTYILNIALTLATPEAIQRVYGGKFAAYGKYMPSSPALLIDDIIAMMGITTNPGHKMMAKLNELLALLMEQVPFLKNLTMFIGKIESRIVRTVEMLFDLAVVLKVKWFSMLSPALALINLLTNKNKQFRDSFTAAYGYGPALMNAQSKLQMSNIIKDVEDPNAGVNGFFKMTTDFSLFMREVTAFVCGTSKGARMQAMKENLMLDLEDGNYPPELKKELINSINDVESVKNKYLDCKRNDTGLVVTAFTRAIIYEIFKGRSDLINKFLPDNTVRSRFNESVDCDYLDNLYDDYYNTKCLLLEAQNDNRIPLINRYENQIVYFEKEIAKEESILMEKASIDKDMKPIIIALNKKGYKTKYSSAGHTKLRKKEDKYRDGVYEGKLYSDARIMFDGDYNFPKAPKYWIWRTVDGKDYLDVDPKAYNLSKGDLQPDAFVKWKAAYMGTLRTWVENLPDKEKTDDKAETKDTKGRTVALENAEEEMNFDDFFTEMMHEMDNELISEGYDSSLV